MLAGDKWQNNFIQPSKEPRKLRITHDNARSITIGCGIEANNENDIQAGAYKQSGKGICLWPNRIKVKVVSWADRHFLLRERRWVERSIVPSSERCGLIYY
ncbi:hypothetical protein Leryth_019504 [Lithospermum erythrorhizon]|nr:hypothetical protein Leryth_019504 [Lithospermum erythrorhizon]